MAALFLVLWAALSPARAQEAPEISFLAVRPPVWVVREGVARHLPAKTGDALQDGDQVRVLPGGGAHLGFANGSVVLLKADSYFTVRSRAGRSRLYVSLGEFLIGLKRKLAEKESLHVHTANAVAAVRGTLFWGKVDVEQNVTYAVFANEISVESEGASVLLRPGEKVVVPYRKPPGPKEAAGIPLDFVDGFAVDGSLQGLKDLAAPTP